MSEPVRPRSRELEIVRVLFDKHLLDRAVNLAEARWDGSGDMVRLAYEWRDLAPADRRARLEEIGPAQLAQFRALAELDPDLALVLDNLEARGVLGPAAVDGEPVPDVPAEPIVSQPEPAPDITPEPAAVEHEPEPAPPVTAPSAFEQHEPVVNVVEPPPVTESDLPIGGSGWSAADLEETVLPHLEATGESLDEFIASEQVRRAASVASAEEMLERVRSRLENSARQVTSNRGGVVPSGLSLPARIPTTMLNQSGQAAVSSDPGERRFTLPPDYWLKRLKAETVVVVDGTAAAPSDDELIALANELGIEFAEYVVEPGTTRDLFGRLRRGGGKIDVEVGPLAASLAWSSLVVVRGRLFPKALDRIRQGMVDIPGTRASVRVAPDSRLLVIP